MSHLRRIAHVEDEPDIRELTRIALTVVAEMELESWADGEEALEALPGFAPDLVLLDVMMPGMDGVELRRRLAETPSLRDVPVVFMTAKSRPSEVAAMRDLDILGIISKPYDPMTLGSELIELWDQR